MIDFDNISKSYGTQTVLDKASFRVNKGERVGLVGPNGAGKSTIFALILGEISPDSGTITIDGEPRIGHLRQEFNPHESAATLIEHAEAGRQDLAETHRKIEELERGLKGKTGNELKADLAHIGRLQTLFEAEGGYTVRARAGAALCGLGFGEDKLAQPFSSFSGGWQMRAELARVLVAEPDLLLLDEPTNYLDIPAIEWLRGYLEDFEGTLLLISHDRYLLNALTGVTIEVANRTTEKYKGPYDWYVKERELRFAQRLAAAKNQQREKERAQLFIDRFRAKNTKATLVQSRIKMLERMEEIVIPQRIVSPGTIRLKKPSRSGQEVARLEDVGLTYDGATWVLRNVSLSVQRGDKIAFVGLNGMGKSTLLRILAGKLAPSEGNFILGHNAVQGYQSQEFAETMDPGATVFETIRSMDGSSSGQEIRNLLGGFGFSGEAIEKKVCVLSGGEKIRLAFARLLSNPPNFLILDEPTTHLDISARESLENALQEFEGTICLVSHDIQFVRKVATGIVAMRPPGIKSYPGGYDYYCEKLAQEIAAAPAAEKQRKESDRKIRRRERAFAVQERGRIKSRLSSALAELENIIGEMEKEERDLAAALENPSRTTDYAAINRRLSGIQAELPRLMDEWQKTAEELGRIK